MLERDDGDMTRLNAKLDTHCRLQNFNMELGMIVINPAFATNCVRRCIDSDATLSCGSCKPCRWNASAIRALMMLLGGM